MAMVTPWPASRSVTALRRRSLPETVWPIEHSTVAMALMPAPPTPITCTRRGTRGSSGTGTGVGGAGSGGMDVHQLGHPGRRIGPGEAPGGGGHLGEPRRIGEQQFEDLGQAVTGAGG